jgi:hypothetical protein
MELVKLNKSQPGVMSNAYGALTLHVPVEQESRDRSDRREAHRFNTAYVCD